MRFFQLRKRSGYAVYQYALAEGRINLYGSTIRPVSIQFVVGTILLRESLKQIWEVVLIVITIGGCGRQYRASMLLEQRKRLFGKHAVKFSLLRKNYLESMLLKTLCVQYAVWRWKRSCMPFGTVPQLKMCGLSALADFKNVLT
jgi:hypothetical protein